MKRLAAIAFLLVVAGCGKEIGDACTTALDCGDGSDINRICDQTSPEGYCTEQGCDWNTCAEEAVCVRFYTASFENKPCVIETEGASTLNCSIDEVCTLRGQCVPRSSEVRFCMRTCSASDDCRTKYECRTEALMREHGGEPVPKPGERLPDDLQAFCAAAPS